MSVLVTELIDIATPSLGTKYSLIYGTFDDLKLKGRFIFKFDEMEHIKYILYIIMDCNTYIGKQTEYFNERDYDYQSINRLKNIVYQEKIKIIIDECLDSEYNILDPSSYYFVNGINIVNTTDKLSYSKYSVLNQYERYYVHAYAIDFVRFEIFSKDYEKEIVNWGLPLYANVEIVSESFDENDYIMCKECEGWNIIRTDDGDVIRSW